jgi:hypothetical protein
MTPVHMRLISSCPRLDHSRLGRGMLSHTRRRHRIGPVIRRGYSSNHCEGWCSGAQRWLSQTHRGRDSATRPLQWGWTSLTTTPEGSVQTTSVLIPGLHGRPGPVLNMPKAHRSEPSQHQRIADGRACNSGKARPENPSDRTHVSPERIPSCRRGYRACS